MPNYRRNRVAGGTYFFTVTLRDRRSDLLVTSIDILRDAVKRARKAQPFHIDAWVVLPDHMHCVWTLPANDTNYSERWKAIKSSFARSMSASNNRSVSMIKRRELGIWQNRYWEHTIGDDRDYAAHMDYVHFNPVKHGLVEGPADWPYSTFRRCVKAGLYPQQWAGAEASIGSYGERSDVDDATGLNEAQRPRAAD